MPISISIDYLNFSSYSDDLVLNSFEQLNQQLQENYPLFPNLEFSPLPHSLVDQLPLYLTAMIPGKILGEEFSCYACRRIFVLCDEGESFVRDYQDENDLAHWGIAIPCKLAVAWVPYPYLIWHEILHLLNAKDCYNKFGINKCPEQNCLMRRAPSMANCGRRLKLCSKNVKRIMRYSSECAACQTGALIPGSFVQD